ncbi:MAG: c-type cytochrome [Candidatus Solibacter sp.]
MQPILPGKSYGSFAKQGQRFALAVALLAVSLPAGPPRSIWERVYSGAQSERGLRVAMQECARCHGPNLEGGEGGPALAGPEFLRHWKGRSVAAWVEYTHAKMPEDNPGGVALQECIDVFAWILHLSGVPAGAVELPRSTEALREIRIEAHPE